MKKNKGGIGGFQTIIASIVTVAVFVFVVILMCTAISFSFKVDVYFYASTIGSTVAIILTFVIWCPTGEEKGLQQEKYKTGKKAYDDRANYIIQHQMFEQLQDFCDYKNTELEKELITERLSVHTIPYKIYELKKNLERTPEQQAEMENLWKKLTDKQKKVVNKLLEHGVKFEKLVPKNVTVGSVSKHSVVNHNVEKSYKVGRMLMKSVWGLGTTFFTYFVVIAPADDFGYPQIIMIIMWFFTFLMAIYTAYITGYKSITIHRHKYNIEQAELCMEFLSKNGVTSKMVEEDGQKD